MEALCHYPNVFYSPPVYRRSTNPPIHSLNIHNINKNNPKCIDYYDNYLNDYQYWVENRPPLDYPSVLPGQFVADRQTIGKKEHCKPYVPLRNINGDHQLVPNRLTTYSSPYDCQHLLQYNRIHSQRRFPAEKDFHNWCTSVPMGVPLTKCTSSSDCTNTPSTFAQAQQTLLPVTRPTLPNPYGKHTDLHEVHDRIFICGSADAENLPLLRSAGVSHVLNMAEGRSKRYSSVDSRFYATSGITYLGIGAFDAVDYDLASHFPQALEFIDSALGQRRNGYPCKVLVHCLRGLSRSPTIVAAYMMNAYNISAAEALTRIRRRRVIFPNAGFLKQLCEFDVYLCNRRTYRRMSTTILY